MQALQRLAAQASLLRERLDKLTLTIALRSRVGSTVLSKQKV